MDRAAIPIVADPAEMTAWSRRARAKGETIGFVPTMGALHEGHLALVRAAGERCTRRVVSIFVNPLQFGPKEDLARYPRDLAGDAALLARVGCDVIFAPTPAAMYPPGFTTTIANPALAARFEGAMRPGHFDGVLTVVAKLFNVVLPHVAVFGQKDAQQATLVMRMVDDLCFPLEIDVRPTVREADGLAMSSRNRFLSPAGRARARSISRGLFEALRLADAGERDAAKLVGAVRTSLRAESEVSEDYAALVDRATLADLAQLDRPALLLVAARVDGVRLLDNLPLTPPERGQ